MSNGEEALTGAIDGLEQLAGQMTPEEALAGLDAASLQTFWREWPDASAWAGLAKCPIESTLTPCGLSMAVSFSPSALGLLFSVASNFGWDGP